MFESLDRSFLSSAIDLSNLWYSVSPAGVLCYSEVGITVYQPIFREVGIDIESIETVDEHKAAVKKVVDKRTANIKAKTKSKSPKSGR